VIKPRLETRNCSAVTVPVGTWWHIIYDFRLDYCLKNGVSENETP